MADDIPPELSDAALLARANRALTAQNAAPTLPLPIPELQTPQMEGWGRYPAMGASALAKGALVGTGALGDLQDFMQNQLNQRLFDPIRHVVGLKDPVTPRDLTGKEMFYPGSGGQSLQNLFPGAQPEQLQDYLQANARELGPAPMPGARMNSPNLTALGRQVGAIDIPSLQSQNAGERYLTATAEGVGSALPYLAMGGGIPAAIRGIVQGAAGGAGGELASEFSDSPWARAIGSVAGALTAGGALAAGGKIANTTRGVNSPVVQAYDRLGIDPALAGDVTGNTFMRQLQAYSSTAPGGAGRLIDTSSRVLGQFGNAVDRIAGRLGRSRTIDDVGQAAEMEGKSWLTQFKADQKSAYNNLDMHVPPTLPAPATNYATTLSDIRATMPGAPATAGVLQSPLTQRLLTSLIEDTKAGPLTWKDLSGIRTRIGEKLAEPQLVGDTSYGELKRLYGALTKDMESAAASRGPAAQKAFADASQITRDGHDFIETTLAKIMPDKGGSAGTSANALLNTTGTTGDYVAQLRAQMPKTADELAAYKLREMGGARPGQQGAAGTQASPSRYLTDVQPERLVPEARDALFGNVSQHLDDLSTVAERMRRTEPFVNRSGTAPTQSLGNSLNNLLPWFLSALGGGGGAYGGGPGGAAIGAALGLVPFATARTTAQLSTMPWLNRTFAAPSALPATARSGLIAGGGLYPQLRGLLAP